MHRQLLPSKARDGLATAMHGMWGSFWIAYGILQVIRSSGRVPQDAGASELGYYFIVLAAITGRPLAPWEGERNWAAFLPCSLPAPPFPRSAISAGSKVW